MSKPVPMFPIYQHLAEKREREDADRRAWEEHLRRWLSCAVVWAYNGGMTDYYPPAPWWVGEGWQWANGDRLTESEALDVALVRSYGCSCVHPLLGWTRTPPYAVTPRCRTCNAEAPDG